MFQFGIENLLKSKKSLDGLKGKRVALLAHPASVDQNLTHTVDLLAKQKSIKLSALFGPQHGLRGEKQDNMIESDDFTDPVLNIPVFSLYGKTRRITPEMFKHFDILLFDLQDVGCRIYTFLTTLYYILEDIQKYPDKEIWVLDRPNPAGRMIEGLNLTPGFESFVGVAPMPMRHGLTLAEAAKWYQDRFAKKAKLKIIPMKGYKISQLAWPKNISWVNPSPNLPRPSGVLVYPGSVMVEGTHLSEGRGTTVPLEVTGMPDWNVPEILKWIQSKDKKVLDGCVVRECFYQPTFHKFQGQLVRGMQFHVDHPKYSAKKFQPFRLYSMLFKATREIHPEFDLWRKPPYEYVTDKLPIDVISGSEELRHWCDDSKATFKQWNERLSVDEKAWVKERKDALLYD